LNKTTNPHTANYFCVRKIHCYTTRGIIRIRYQYLQLAIFNKKVLNVKFINH